MVDQSYQSCFDVYLRNFAKFTEKHLCQDLFFKVSFLSSAILSKKRLWHKCFPVNFVRFLRTLFLTETVAASAFYTTALFPYPLKTSKR